MNHSAALAEPYLVEQAELNMQHRATHEKAYFNQRPRVRDEAC
jgi:hypothetical protein